MNCEQREDVVLPDGSAVSRCRLTRKDRACATAQKDAATPNRASSAATAQRALLKCLPCHARQGGVGGRGPIPSMGRRRHTATASTHERHQQFAENRGIPIERLKTCKDDADVWESEGGGDGNVCATRWSGVAALRALSLSRESSSDDRGSTTFVLRLTGGRGPTDSPTPGAREFMLEVSSCWSARARRAENGPEQHAAASPPQRAAAGSFRGTAPNRPDINSLTCHLSGLPAGMWCMWVQVQGSLWAGPILPGWLLAAMTKGSCPKDEG